MLGIIGPNTFEFLGPGSTQLTFQLENGTAGLSNGRDFEQLGYLRLFLLRRLAEVRRGFGIHPGHSRSHKQDHHLERVER
jgi:hypothetical protein